MVSLYYNITDEEAVEAFLEKLANKAAEYRNKASVFGGAVLTMPHAKLFRHSVEVVDKDLTSGFISEKGMTEAMDCLAQWIGWHGFTPRKMDLIRERTMIGVSLWSDTVRVTSPHFSAWEISKEFTNEF